MSRPDWAWDWLLRLLAIRFIRFLVVGGLNTLFGYGVFALLLWLGLHFSLAAFLSTLAGVLFNFRTTGKLVFGSHDWSLIFRFLLVYSILYLCNVAGIWLLEQIGIPAMLGGALLLLPMAVLGYLLNKTLVFDRKGKHVEGPEEQAMHLLEGE